MSIVYMGSREWGQINLKFKNCWGMGSKGEKQITIPY
jgi:hypothetical protein